jgi:hypothetical protein
VKEIYRLTKCKIKNTEFEFDFKFGIVYDDLGVIKFDLYLEDEQKIQQSDWNNILHDYFDLDAETEDNNKLTGTHLSITSLSSHNSKIKLTCFEKIIFEEVRNDFPDEHEKEAIFYIELEGLKIEFSDITFNNKVRGGEKVNEFNDFERDHTSCLLIFNGDEYSCNHFKAIFYNHRETENIVVDFTKAPYPNNLKFDTYSNFKRDFIYFLSFINGANVKVRREYTGRSYTLGQVNSQKYHIYSFPKVNNKYSNDYIPIADPFYRSSNILGYFLMKHFDKFIEVNQKLDINSIIFYLNGANQAKSIEERFFILIIAFERLASNFINNWVSDKEHVIIPNADFNLLKPKLIKVINDCKKEKISSLTEENVEQKKEWTKQYDKFSNIIGQMNMTNKSVSHKFRELLKAVNIPINDDIKYILDYLRHTSIHKGEIDEGQKGLKYTLVLDELIRDIILNLIDYTYKKKSKVYREKNEF